MKHTTKKLWLAAALVAVMGLASEVKAAYPNPTQALDIKVSINAQKSLEVGTTWYNFGALPISSTVVSGSSVAVWNDSGGLVETYTIQGASATGLGGGGNPLGFIERGLEGFDVDIAHQLADVLPLPFFRTVLGDALCISQGNAQSLWHLDLFQSLGRKRRQLNAH